MMSAMKIATHTALALMLLTSLSVLAASGSVAHAAEPVKKIKVLGMQIEGTDLSAKDKTDLFRVVQAALRSRAQVDLLKPPERELTDEMIDLECIDIDAACLTRLGKKYKAEQVFYSQVDKGKGGAYVLLVRVVDVAKGKAIHDTKTNMPNRMAIANGLEKQVAKVFGAKGSGPAPPKKDEEGFIEIKVPNNSDAKIFINKEFAATGEIKVKRKPGKYTVKVTADGFTEQIFSVEVTPGRTTTRSVILKGMDGGVGPIKKPTEPEDEDEFYETWWFWTIVGVVVAGGVAGIVVATTSDTTSNAVGNVTFSVDPQQSWRDTDVQGGQR